MEELEERAEGAPLTTPEGPEDEELEGPSPPAVASLDSLKSGKFGALQFVWLHDMPNTEHIMDALGGTACVWAYTVKDYEQWATFQTFDDKGNPVVDISKIRWSQFRHVLRNGAPPDGEPIIPGDRQTERWIKANFSPHVIDQVIRISDDLSGWRDNWSPFGRRNSGR